MIDMFKINFKFRIFLVVKNCKLEYVYVYCFYNMIIKMWGSWGGGGVIYIVFKGFICK